jgi:hypothetical protein
MWRAFEQMKGRCTPEINFPENKRKIHGVLTGKKCGIHTKKVLK